MPANFVVAANMVKDVFQGGEEIYIDTIERILLKEKWEKNTLQYQNGNSKLDAMKSNNNNNKFHIEHLTQKRVNKGS